MKVKTKLLLGLSALPILILLIAAVGWFQVINLNKLSDSLSRDYDTSFLAEQIHRKVKDEALSLRHIVLSDDQAVIDKEIAYLSMEGDSVSRDIETLNTMVSSAEQRALIDDIRLTNSRFNRYKDSVMEHVSKGDKEEAVALIVTSGDGIQDEFLDVISMLTTSLEEEVSASLGQMPKDFQRQLLVGSVISVIGILIVISLIFRIVWMVMMRLHKVSAVMVNVANGRADLSTRIEAKQIDEIDDVAHSFNTMAVSLQEQMSKHEEMNWVKSHVAEITADMSGQQELESLSRMFLSKVVPLVDGCHAVFYMMGQDEETKEPLLQLIGSYAFKERKHLTNQFRMGEGLIGQAAFERTPILLTEVPDQYIRIKSGLGEAAPQNVYVLPILYEDDLKAVIEIAALKPFTEVQQAFLEELINNLGIIIDNLQGRLKLASLLQESQALMEEIQVQSEELQSQQDELRATNEELEEQTEALKASEEKLKAQQEQLEQTNAELEEKANVLAVQNKRFEITNQEMAQARAELEEKARQLAISSKYKSEFLANMSHELRTPLNSLLILSKLLADNNEGNLTEKQVGYSKTIYASGNDLLTLINDILDLAKIESGRMDVNLSRVAIQDVVEFVESRFNPIANEKKLAFNIHLADPLPADFYSDELRVQQVLKNLLSNAFKFTQKGEVTLDISLKESNNSNECIRLAVRDTGIGIPQEKQDLILQLAANLEDRA